MKQILNDRSFQLSILLTLLFLGTGIAFLFLGLVNYSWILFILLPIVLGIAIGAMPNKQYFLWGSLIATVITLIGLYIPGLSGLLCIVMTIPIVLPLIFLGYVISHLSKRYNDLKSTTNLPILLLPLIPFLSGSVQQLSGFPYLIAPINSGVDTKSEKARNTPAANYANR